MAIQWNQIKPDFSSSNTSMRNAMTGISEAGTVFDKMRQGILDEEQRAIENARAAEATALAQAELDERIRANQADEAQAAATLAEQIRHARATEATAAGQLALAQQEARQRQLDARAAKEASELLYNLQHGNANILKLQQARDEAAQMTPETYALAASSLTNPATKQAYTSLEDYQKQTKQNYETAYNKFIEDNKLSPAAVQDLSSAAGLERMWQMLYATKGGFGLGSEYMPSYITRGAQLESEAAKADLNAKVEAAKLASLSETKYGNWADVNKVLKDSGFTTAEATNMTNTILQVGKALPGMSKKAIFNSIMSMTQKPEDASGALGVAWEKIFGKDRLSVNTLNSQEINALVKAINPNYKAEASSSDGDSDKNTLDSGTVTLSPAQSEQIAKDMRQARIEAERTGTTFDETSNRQNRIASIVRDSQDKVAEVITDIPALINQYTNEELASVGLNRNSKALTEQQLAALRAINDEAVLKALRPWMNSLDISKFYE